METTALDKLKETKDQMQKCRKKYFRPQLKCYGWSIAGNILSAFAAFKANTSPRLFILLYILKHFVWWKIRPKSSESEIEREINSLYHDSMHNFRKDCPKYPVTFIISSHPPLTFSVPFVSFLWDLTKSVYRENPNYEVLDKALIVLSDTVKRQKYEIEKLIPMLKVIYPLLQGSPCKVVEAIPGVEIPGKNSTEEALLKGHITIQNRPVSNNPLKTKTTEIEKATKKKKEFYKLSLDVLESAGKCLQAREEAKVLPTFKLAQNLKLLEDANKNLDAMENFKFEFQRLDNEKQKNQQAIIEGIATMIDNTTEALENVSDFGIDIRSEMKKSRIQKSAKLVQEYANQGCEINHQVKNALKAMTEANKAMKDIKNSSKSRIFGFEWFGRRMQINEIKIPVGTENDWITESKNLADSVKLLGEHAEKLKLNSPEDIMNGIYASCQKENMTKNAKDMAIEALGIVDEIEWEVFNYNSDSQFCVIGQVFKRIWSRIWSTSTETAKMQRETPVSKMRSKAQKLHLKVANDKSFSNKLHVDKMSLIIAFLGTVVDVFNISMLFKKHPKEKLIQKQIEEIEKYLQEAGIDTSDI